MDLSQYLEIFIDESKEHLQTLNDQVLILESEPENVDTANRGLETVWKCHAFKFKSCII